MQEQTYKHGHASGEQECHALDCGLQINLLSCASRSQVLIDGVDIQALQLKWLRQHMGIVNQARNLSRALHFVC